MDDNNKLKFDDPLIKEVEKEYLKILTDNLRNGSLSLEETKIIPANFFFLFLFLFWKILNKKSINLL